MTIEELEELVKSASSDITTLVQQFEQSTGVHVHSIVIDRLDKKSPATARLRTRLKVEG